MAARSFAGLAVTDTIWIGALTALLLVYLMYALLVPEKF